MNKTSGILLRTVLLASLLSSSLFVSLAKSQQSSSDAAPAVSATAATSAPSTSTIVTAADWRSRKGLFFKRNWGVEIVGVKPVSSGYMLSFRYKVLDPEKAKVLNDRKAVAYLIDDATGTRLAVPAMENVGELRSGATPEADRIYFMIFGNPGKLVKSGSKVTIVAGNLQVPGLIVD